MKYRDRPGGRWDVGETDMTAFDNRRSWLLEREAKRDFAADIYGGVALARLAVGRDVEAANANLRHVANWFGHPHPKGRDLRGECDFVAIKLARAYYQFRDLLEMSTQEAIRRFFLTQDFSSIYMSENHYLIFRIARYLMAQALPDETFHAYGRLGSDLLVEDSAVLQRFIRFRAGHGWGEFDSAHYIEADWKCLCGLFDFTWEDLDLKKLTEDMLNLLLADMAVDSLDGMYGGAHGRIYPPGAHDHATTGSYAFQYLYFGQGDPALVQSCLVEALLSGFRPDPLVVDVARGRKVPYENRERKHLHNVNDLLPSDPLGGGICKYTWWTPGYVMGCVQYQDDYPEGNPACWYAHHQQHQWDLTFAGGTRARVFTHHPGTDGEHNYWTGDRGCGCGLFFQNKSALLALYEIAPDQPLQFIHAYVPKDAFDEVVEEDGFIFVRKGEAYGALKLMSGYEWTREGEWKDVEIKSPGARHAVVCEAGASGEFGSFEEFRREIMSNLIELEADPLRLVYHSKRNGTILLHSDGRRELGGVQVSFDYGTYDSPYLRSDWKSGVVQLTNGVDRKILDFSSLKYMNSIILNDRPITFRRDHLKKQGGETPCGETVGMNHFHLERNGQPWLPTMGEFHYSRYSFQHWEEELRKIKAGGVEIVATYVFWIHHEEEEGIFEWSGNYDLRRFVQLCGKLGLWAFPRIGPFDHGDVRNGGLPDWLYGYPFESRSNDPRYLAYVKRFYGELGQQLKGLMFKAGGPVVGIQIENEFMDSAAPWECTQNPAMEYTPKGSGGNEHMMNLKRLAIEAGLDAPLFTATGWGSAPIMPEEFLPVFGGYAFYSWIDDPSTQEPTGNYVFRKAHGRPHPRFDSGCVPYACCELGAGMQVYYKNRPVVPASSVEAMHVVQLGCGGNLMGYYEYHGGSNPVGKHGYLHEYRDPRISNDYQACLREFGQTHESYHRLRRQFLFLNEWGPLLAPMQTVLPEGDPVNPGDSERVRFAVRAQEDHGFLFINNYQDHVEMRDHEDVRFQIRLKSADIIVPRHGGLRLKKDVAGIMPLNLTLDGAGLQYATAQMLTRIPRDGGSHYFFFALEGILPEYAFDAATIGEPEVRGGTVVAENGLYFIMVEPGTDCLVTLTTVEEKKIFITTLTNSQSLECWKANLWGRERVMLSDANLIFHDDSIDARRMGNPSAYLCICPPVEGGLVIGGQKLIPSSDGVFEGYRLNAQPRERGIQIEAVARDKAVVQFPPDAMQGLVDLFLQVDYEGDVGSAYLDGKLIHDNFWNGTIWEIGLKQFAPRVIERGLYLKIVPLKKDSGVKVEFSEMAAIRVSEDGQGVAAFRSIRAVPEYGMIVAQAKIEHLQPTK